MTTKRFNLNSSRSSKQGTLINVGKESEEYKALTNTMTMAAEDMAEIGLTEGQMAVVRTEFGEAEFKCAAGKIPLASARAGYDRSPRAGGSLERVCRGRLRARRFQSGVARTRIQRRDLSEIDGQKRG